MLQKSFISLRSEVVETDHAQLNYTFAKEKTVVKVAMLSDILFVTNAVEKEAKAYTASKPFYPNLRPVL